MNEKEWRNKRPSKYNREQAWILNEDGIPVGRVTDEYAAWADEGDDNGWVDTVYERLPMITPEILMQLKGGTREDYDQGNPPTYERVKVPKLRPLPDDYFETTPMNPPRLKH